MNLKTVLLIIFCAASAAHIGIIVMRKETARRVSKVLVMPLLLAVYLAGTAESGSNYYFFVIPALVLGWLGDVLLIRIDKKINFTLGLASFLLGHLCYIIVFAGIIGGGAGGGAGRLNLPAFLIFAPQAFVTSIVIFRLIKPAKDMFIAVIFYMVVLVTMGLFGFQVFLLNTGLGGLLILSGCFSFVVSDTILAYYTFRKLKLSGSVLIMAFYILAQAEIVLGLMAL